MNLVIVESPAKAKTIQKFLGNDYKVTSSYGHIRDLKKRDFSIDFDNKFQPIYEIPEDKQELVSNLQKEAKKADMVWLASDEDREGEAISWHLYEVLGLEPERTKRIVFHEITKSAILAAIKSPRKIDMDLVNAQQARRVLDRIVGFELSPILWRKVKPALSAGRVQSVAVRLIVEREREIENFKSEASYRVTGTFATLDPQTKQPVLVNAELSQRFKTKEEAQEFLKKAAKATYTVSDIQQKPLKRQPAPPFTTSTLQQEAARKLHYTVSQTMSIAQRLYEAGQITYMRTDSVNLSTLCLNASKEQILKTMGEEYLETRNYVTHTKGAQEAHEAIRPTYMDHQAIEGSTAEQRLYELIWKRTIASQMSDALIEKTQAEISISGEKELKFIATGEVIKFDGFLKVYIEGNDEESESENEVESRLPALAVNQSLDLNTADAVERYTMHPQRYTEASLVKKMEELGIGRPSTYAPTISTIQAREYVVKSDRPAEKREITRLHLDAKTGKINSKTAEETYNNDKGKLIPTDIGVVVNDFLTDHFPEIMSYNFTATVEGEFDEIAEGKEQWFDCIDSFYKLFHPLITTTLEERSDHKAGERVLGKDPKTGHTISVKISRFGPVVQIGAADEVSKPQFAALQKGMSIATITLEEALKLFELPKDLGDYEDKTVTVGVGKFGPYVRHDNKYISIPKDINPHHISLEEAIKLIEEKREEDRRRVLRTFDEDPELQMLNGRFGPYLSKGGKNYKLSRNKDLEHISYEECVEIMNAADAAAASEDGEKKPRRGRYSKKG
jgi:DNA topoisomerase-1